VLNTTFGNFELDYGSLSSERSLISTNDSKNILNEDNLSNQIQFYKSTRIKFIQIASLISILPETDVLMGFKSFTKIKSILQFFTEMKSTDA
jgi:hypothetical protein